jgi:hypothetical protein
MSFWDNNKDTFLAAGKATAKGIGTGTKALGKAGYRTYKNSQGERRGVPDNEADKAERSSYETRNNTNTSAYSGAYSGSNTGSNTGSNSGTSYYQSQPRHVDVNAYPLPPKRVAGPGEVRPLGHQDQGQQHQQMQQPQQHYSQNAQYSQAPYQPQQPQYPQQPQQPQYPQQPYSQDTQYSQAPYHPQQQIQPQPLTEGERPIPTPPTQAGTQPQFQPQLQQYQNGHIQQSHPAETQQPTYQVEQQQQSYLTEPQQQLQQPIFQPQPQLQDPYQQSPEANDSNQRPPAYDDSQLQNTQQEPTQVDSEPVKKSLPDPSLFAPPPIHKNRGVSEPSDSASYKKTGVSGKPSHVGKHGTSTTPKPTTLDMDPSKIGQPPPKPYRENSETTLNSASSNVRQTPPLPTRQSSNTTQNQLQTTSTPVPPPRSNTASVNSTSSQASSLPAPLPLPDNTGSEGSQKKAPPPKPIKKPMQLTSDGSSRNAEPDTLKQEPKNYMPNFAEEIALRKNTNSSLSGKGNLNSEDFNSELNSKLEPVNFENHAKPEPSDATPSLVKPKPKVMPKPKIGPKPSISPKPETKGKPIIKSKSEIKAKPDLKPKPIIGTKPVTVFGSKKIGNDMPISDSPSNLHVNKSNTPPPPIPRPRSAASNTSTPPPPPPSRNYRRAKAAAPPIELGPPNLDLQLSTGWFATTSGPMVLPKDLSGLNYNTSYLYVTRGSDKSHTRNINLRLRDLAIISYAITWLNDNINNAKMEVTKFIPSPISNKIPTVDELVANQNRFGEYVASWSENKMGQKVGTGECWDLARDALLKGCGKHAFVSTYYHHGYPIILLQGSENGVSYVDGKSPLDELRRGDILQYTSCIFKDKIRGSVSTVGNPDHTSVVLENTGDKLIIAEQNINNLKIVKKTEICLQNLTQGIVVGYRPMPAGWGGNL